MSHFRKTLTALFWRSPYANMSAQETSRRKPVSSVDSTEPSRSFSGRGAGPLTTGGTSLDMGLEAVKARLRAMDLRERFHYPDHQYLGLRRSAVLVPLVSRDGVLHVLLTQRAHGLRVQGGHVGFPGGVRDTDDAHELDTALREAEEEIGLSRDQVEVLAMLPPSFIEPNFTVVPFLGLVSPHFRPRPNPHEVALVFELPLHVFLSNDVTMHMFDHGGFSSAYPVLRSRHDDALEASRPMVGEGEGEWVEGKGVEGKGGEMAPLDVTRRGAGGVWGHGLGLCPGSRSRVRMLGQTWWPPSW